MVLWWSCSLGRRMIYGALTCVQTVLPCTDKPQRPVKLPEEQLRTRCWGDARTVTPGCPWQVHNISLAEGETLTVESMGGLEPILLANESFLLRGQVIRSPANLLTLRFQSPRPPSPGSYCFHYQGMGQLHCRHRPPTPRKGLQC